MIGDIIPPRSPVRIPIFLAIFIFLLAFVVKYKIGEDVSLAEHFDNAEVTLNVSISDAHTGQW